MARLLLGLDLGLTAVKAVLYDLEGNERAVARQLVPREHTSPEHAERDPELEWRAAAAVIGQTAAAVGPGEELAAMGISGYGDGLHLLDASGRTVRRPILSADQRARGVLAAWEQEGRLAELGPIIGQRPYVGAPLPLLVWLMQHEPEHLKAARWLLFPKDYLRYRLTGRIATEVTDASSSLLDPRRAEYAVAALRLAGVGVAERLLPPLLHSTDVAGMVTPEAAAQTGLPAGLPVIAGMHDISASSLGSGVVEPGHLCMVAGTWSNNLLVSAEPLVHPELLWHTRAFALPGRWLLTSSSPASAGNLEWVLEQLGITGSGRYEGLDSQAAAAGPGAGGVIYHPFLYGSPYPVEARAGFFGLGQWHGRGHMLRAVFEGVAHNHRYHLDRLRSGTAVERIHLTGGVVNSPVWCQVFADLHQQTMHLPDGSEHGARGAALAAGLGAGVYSGTAAAVAAAVHVEQSYLPEADLAERYARGHAAYLHLVQAMVPIWAELANLAKE